MHAVKDNPYRTLGLFGNSTEKELQKQISIIKRYAEVGKIKPFDYDFPFLGDVTRNLDKVQDAASKIEQTKNKIHYALFWFINHGHVDEAALNNLREGNIHKATEIWEKTLKTGAITSKNFSSASNLSTLQLGVVTNNGTFDIDSFLNSIDLKGRLASSSEFDSFISSIIGPETSINKEAVLKEFADEVIQILKPYLLKPVSQNGSVETDAENGIEIYRWESGDLYFGEMKEGKRTGFGIYLWAVGHFYTGYFDTNKLSGEGIYVYPDGTRNIGNWINGAFEKGSDINKVEIELRTKEALHDLRNRSSIKFNGITIVQLINSFRSFPNDIKQYVSKKFIEGPVGSIESLLDQCTEARKAEPGKATTQAVNLYNVAKSDINLLKGVLGESNVQYQLLVNKLTEEILSCSIAYYNHYQEHASHDPGELALKILKLAKILKPTGQAKSRLEENEQIIQEWVDEKPERDKGRKVKTDVDFIAGKLKNFQNLPDTIPSAKDLVLSTKPRLLNIKSALGSSDEFYLQISDAVVNNGLGMIISTVNESQNTLQNDLLSLTRIVSAALEVMSELSTLDMTQDLKQRFNVNYDTINGISSQLLQVLSRAAKSSNNNSGCYIATMAYESADHPQVNKLRDFRDQYLAPYHLGQIFISFYYAYSPWLVKRLGGNKTTNKMIRALLNFIIRISI